MCSYPNCEADLTSILSSDKYVIGEMAHIVGRKPAARRGTPQGGANNYDNLILLCPTHHTSIDKAAEGTYSESTLLNWKSDHEKKIRNAIHIPRFSTFDELKSQISRLLISNKITFDSFGPKSQIARSNPDSNLFTIWELRRIDRILPNNEKILRCLDANTNLIPIHLLTLVENFRAHAEAYKQHAYEPLDDYPLFPVQFSKQFSEHE